MLRDVGTGDSVVDTHVCIAVSLLCLVCVCCCCLLLVVFAMLLVFLSLFVVVVIRAASVGYRCCGTFYRWFVVLWLLLLTVCGCWGTVAVAVCGCVVVYMRSDTVGISGFGDICVVCGCVYFAMCIHVLVRYVDVAGACTCVGCCRWCRLSCLR